MKEGYFQRLEFVAGRIEGYDEDMDLVDCKKHGFEEYHVFLDRNNEWQAVCRKCKPEIFPDLKPAIPQAKSRCQTDMCYCTSDAVTECIACKKSFCDTHMDDQKLCIDCVTSHLLKEAEDNGPSRSRFYQC